MALQATVLLELNAVLSAVGDLQSGSSPLNYRKTLQFADGVGVGQANKLWSDTRQLAASANEDLDLAGSLTDIFGATFTLARVKGLLVAADAGNTNNVVVGGAAANGLLNWVGDATDKVVVRPGGLLVLVARDATGYAVTAATGDLLRVANSGAGSVVNYDIVVWGGAT